MDKQLALTRLTSLPLLSQSLVEFDGMEYAVLRSVDGRKLVVLADAADDRYKQFEGDLQKIDQQVLAICPLTSQNAAVLRSQLPWLQSQPIGLATSAGMGDRLGVATPGHVRAVLACDGLIMPIFAQQSIREMARTNRTPQQVMDDATWGVFQENWTQGFGADADHLKTFADINACLEAGFTFFTIDPGEFVDNRAAISNISDLRQSVLNLPATMGCNENGLMGKEVQVGRLNFKFDEDVLLRAMVKYGKAVWHVVQMYEYLLNHSVKGQFELEVSVDETDLPTSHAEHYYIASELSRLGVKWVSIAPRYVGDFEKGVDYIGDPEKFEMDISGHAEIARILGPYKLSLHSGSDKFSIYPAAARQTQGLVHLKTAGTSYLEAIRTVSMIDPILFREIYAFSRDRYEDDKLSYHVSAKLERAPKVIEGDSLEDVLDQFDAREILHVTFGSVLKEKNQDGRYKFYDRLMGLLENHPEVYAQNLRRHFERHLKPFCGLE